MKVKDIIEGMPNVIWARQFNPGWGGTWYPSKPTRDMFIFADSISEDEQIERSTYHKYVRDDSAPEIFAWIMESTRDGVVTQIGYFRLEAHPSINETVGYRKAE